jgi:phage baseplate assembly protein W
LTPRKYNFNAVGETQSLLDQRNEQSKSSPPIGIVTPLQFGVGDDGLLLMHRDAGSMIADNFRNLISTNWGERLMDYKFGANLKELVFELGKEETDIEAGRRIKAATDRYLPYVSLDSFETFNNFVEEAGIARIGVKVTYTIPLIDSKTRLLEVTLYTAS